MLGFYDYTVVLTYVSLGISIFGITRALQGDFKIAIFCLALSGLCDMFDGKIARTYLFKCEYKSDRWSIGQCIYTVASGGNFIGNLTFCNKGRSEETAICTRIRIVSQGIFFCLLTI